MDLETHDDPEVENVLIHVGGELSTTSSVAASCSEAFAEIWMRKGELHLTALKVLRAEAHNDAVALIRSSEP
jgi:hypothetical protein